MARITPYNEPRILRLLSQGNEEAFDITQPLLLDGNGGQASDIRYRSLITGYLDGIGGGGVTTDSLGRFKLRAFSNAYRILKLTHT